MCSVWVSVSKNPKSETRNPKQIQMLKIRNSKPAHSSEFLKALFPTSLSSLCSFVAGFEFVSDFEFRISDFQLREL